MSNTARNTLWVHGPIALDTMIYLDHIPAAGEFLRADRVENRTGGTAANIAFGLASTDLDIGFITWLGNDEIAQKLEAELLASPIKHQAIMRKDAPSEHVQVYVDKDGERTILGINKSYLKELHLEGAPIQPGDTFFFSLWWKEYREDLQYLKNLGCNVVVGARALDDDEIDGADLVIGSIHDYSGRDPHQLLERFPRIVLTQGAHGSREYQRDKTYSQEIFPAQAVDATGAGDAFITGYLTAHMKGMEPQDCLRLGSQWASLAVETYSSIPPAFADVCKKWAIEF